MWEEWYDLSRDGITAYSDKEREAEVPPSFFAIFTNHTNAHT